MQTSVISPTEPVTHQMIDLQLPSFNLTEDALAELYTFLQYLKFKYKTDLEEAIDVVEEELDSLECEKALNGTEPTIAWSEVKANLKLVQMYEIRLTKRAERQLSRLVPEVQVRLQLAIDALDENPRPDGVKKFKGKDSQYRIRVGDYRIIYTIEDQRLLIVVVQLGTRSNVYK